MVRVYAPVTQIDEYQYFFCRHSEESTKIGRWDCTSRKDSWSPPEVYVPEPNLKPGDFYNWQLDVVITSPRATSVLMPHLMSAGELLSLPYDGYEFSILNVLHCIDCLNVDETVWRVSDDGVRLMPKKFAFHEDRLPRTTTLFKIPQTCKAELYLVEGLTEIVPDFRHVVDQEGLRGITFELLWDSGDQPSKIGA